MARIKTPAEIKMLTRGGAILSAALRRVMDACKPGASTLELDLVFRSALEQAGATPSFLGYKTSPKDTPFPSAICVSMNDEVVHGSATPERFLKDGDIVSLDVGAWYGGLATDMAATVFVGHGSARARRLIADTRTSLEQGLAVIRAGADVRSIGAAIEDFLTPKGYGIVRDLVGHGVGHAVHEEPAIPNYREPRARRSTLETGMVLAIEPMVTLGGWEVYQKKDRWTIATADHSLSAHWEVTIAVTDDGYDLVTPWPDQTAYASDGN